MSAAFDALLVSGPQIAAYGFPDGHPFGVDRHAAFIGSLSAPPVLPDLRDWTRLPRR